MSSEPFDSLLEEHRFVTNLMWEEISRSNPVETSNDAQNDKDFLAFESAMPAVSRAPELLADMSNDVLGNKHNNLKFWDGFRNRLKAFRDLLPQSCQNIHIFKQSALATGSYNREMQRDLLPKSAAQWQESVRAATDINTMIEQKAYSLHSKLLEDSSSKELRAPLSTECIDLSLESLFDHLTNGTCQIQKHEALLRLSGWNGLQDKNIFHIFLSSCETAKDPEISRCYTLCTHESQDANCHGGLSICKQREQSEGFRTPLWLSFNRANIWLSNSRGLPVMSTEQRNQEQMALESLIRQSILKISDTEMEVKKFRLAYRLVCSLRHLFLGPWIQQNLNLANIFVMGNSHSNTSDILTEPYINCSLVELPQGKNVILRDFTSGNSLYSEFFLSLAQVLIDIFKGEMGRYDYGTELEAWYNALAEEAEEILKDEPVKGYREAVHGCLLFFRHCQDEMGQPHRTRSRARWVILENIVAPLKKNLEKWDSQASRSGNVLGTSSGKGLLQRAHKTESYQPVFTLFSDEDDSNDVPWPIESPALSKYDFSTCMEKFLKKHIIPSAEVDIGTCFPYKRVKVAIIDTGLYCAEDDYFFHTAEKRVQETRSFVSGESNCIDTHGHGTHVTRLILRHAPECEVYVAKISKTRYFAETQVEQLAKALEWAGDQADIINMSFGLGQLCPSPRLNEVLSDLARRRKLLFAAASNSGGNGSRPWPASKLGVFCIHTTNERGNTNRNMNPTPRYDEDNFATLGENIESYWNGEKRCISGTSFATPIAAAMAANILEFARRNLSEGEANALQAYGPMRRLFLDKMTDNGKAKGAYHYIKPWSDQLWGENASKENVTRALREFLILGT